MVSRIFRYLQKRLLEIVKSFTQVVQSFASLKFMDFQSYRILGCPCVAVRDHEVASQIISFVRDKKAGYTVAINAEKIWRYKSDPELRSVIERSIFPYPDGAGAVLGLGWLHSADSDKVNMPIRALEVANCCKLKTFILGADEVNHELAVANIKAAYPNIALVGHIHGYHPKEFALKQVLACEPELILIAMGSPIQEFWAAEIVSRLRCGLAIGCGGALDILSGNVKRAPNFMIRNNLEWLHRLWKQPSRISRQLFLPLFMLQLSYFFFIKKFLRYRSDK